MPRLDKQPSTAASITLNPTNFACSSYPHSRAPIAGVTPRPSASAITGRSVTIGPTRASTRRSPSAQDRPTSSPVALCIRRWMFLHRRSTPASDRRARADPKVLANWTILNVTGLSVSSAKDLRQDSCGFT
ncbi:uncharacterized protein M6B38_106195 [Iris pallida]|uniref:Uncharacterized protein n=1 Tax=Iris pallida TaxID=29817 RepID=A0AAX6ES50_IRIPA|nr:uncharacterized protein M6B38_106195 [Iris pallida]